MDVKRSACKRQTFTRRFSPNKPTNKKKTRHCDERFHQLSQISA